MSGCPVNHGMKPISEAYDPLSPEQTESPHPMLKRAREEEPVFFSPTYRMWFVTKHEDVVRVLRDTDTFSNLGIITVNSDRLPAEVKAVLAEGYPQVPGMTDNDPPGHDRIRDMVNWAFGQRLVAAMEPHIRDVANEMVDKIAKNGRADILEEYAFTFPLVVIGDILGVERKDLANLKQWSDDWVALLAAPLTLDQQMEAARGFVKFQKFYFDLIESKRREPKQDLISHMIQADPADGGPKLTTLEMVNVCMSATWAGHQTVTSAIVMMIFNLLRDPAMWARIQTERALIPAAFEETLRHDSPLTGMLRFTKKDAEVGGVKIPAGQAVQALFGSANWDEKVFKQPEAFDCTRKNASHLGFGRGVHYCLGAQLARLEGRVALEVLIDRLPNLRLADGQKFEYLPNFLYRTLKRLDLQWDAPN